MYLFFSGSTRYSHGLSDSFPEYSDMASTVGDIPSQTQFFIRFFNRPSEGSAVALGFIWDSPGHETISVQYSMSQ